MKLIETATWNEVVRLQDSVGVRNGMEGPNALIDICNPDLEQISVSASKGG